jgi:hypothetical protein
MPAAQNGPLALLQAPQRATVFGGGKHTKEPPFSRSQVSPPATLQPAPVTGLQGGTGVKHSASQALLRQAMSALAASLTLQVASSASALKQLRQSPSSLQSASSWQQPPSAQVPQSPS